MSAIEIRDVTKAFGDVVALDDVSLSVPGGSVFGLLGTNGAGKTTLFRLLVDHLRPDAGTVEVAGRRPDAGRSIRRRVGYLPQRVGFPDAFTGRESLSFHARMRGVPASERESRIDAVLDVVGLSDAADREIGGYSQGMVRRLGLASVLVGRPDVLLLDEPTSGLDPEGVEAFHAVVRRYNEESDATVVYTSHTLAEVEAVCDRVAILDGGEVLVEGEIDRLRRAAGDDVTVTVAAAPASDLASAREQVAAESGVSAVSRDGDRLTITCRRERAFDVLASVHELVDVEGFEVSEPDLTDVFHRALGESAAAGTDPAANGDTPTSDDSEPDEDASTTEDAAATGGVRS
ncbi:MAG: ATP-binding cassette domain-containing protein [Halobacterium sp.]